MITDLARGLCSLGMTSVCALCLSQSVGAAFGTGGVQGAGQGLRAAGGPVVGVGSRADPEFSSSFWPCILLSPGELQPGHCCTQLLRNLLLPLGISDIKNVFYVVKKPTGPYLRFLQYSVFSALS